MARWADDATATDASRMWWWLLAAAMAGLLWWLWRRAGRARHDDRPPPPPESVRRADRLLLETDDAVHTSRQELDVVAVVCGPTATGQFDRALDRAGEELDRCLLLRRDVDGLALDDPRRVALLDDIMRGCLAANAALDAVVDDFDRLRDLPGRAAETLELLESEHEDVTVRTEQAAVLLAALRERHTDTAVRGIETNVDESVDRLRFARLRLDDARLAVEDADTDRAAAALRAGEEALHQARLLSAAVSRRRTELAAAARALPTLLTAADGDIARARTVEGGLGPVLTQAERLVARTRATMLAGPFDPLAAERRLRHGLAVVDDVSAAVRDPADRARSARTGTESALRDAGTAIAAAADFLVTRRGGIGVRARLALAMARRERDRAVAATADPVRRLAAAESALRWARQASVSARRDVTDFVASEPADGSGRAGAVLGGILLGGLFTGRAAAAGPLVPGSFGGGGTRARRGIGTAGSLTGR